MFTPQPPVAPAYLWLFEDISSDGVEVSQVFDGGDVFRDGFDHHLTGRQHQLMGSHLKHQQSVHTDRGTTLVQYVLIVHVQRYFSLYNQDTI